MKIYHYSPYANLQEIDPAMYGTSGKNISPEYKQGHKHMVPRSYFYMKDEPESIIAQGRHRYETWLPKDFKIYDLAHDPDKIVEATHKQTGMVGRGLYDAVEQGIKDRGYHGYHNTSSGLPHALAVFHKIPIIKQHPHPHSYDWHDQETPAIKKSEDLYKDHPHLQAHGPTPPKTEENEQAGGVGMDTFQPIMQHFGTITPGKKTNLKFYHDLEHHHDPILSHVKEQGYAPYFAGGKYGKPDLANKNYNTKHLLIYDPSPQSGGDFGNEKYTSAWRHAHELAHAQTYPMINKLYGEGRRLGKLGVRTPNEMKRAVHWEWLAAHKQRDIMDKLGYKMPDADFHKELNTVLGDAAHRAITGKFTEPSEMGFEPHDTKPDLKHTLGLIDQHAKNLGLEHEHDTLADLKRRKSAT